MFRPLNILFEVKGPACILPGLGLPLGLIRKRLIGPFIDITYKCEIKLSILKINIKVKFYIRSEVKKKSGKCEAKEKYQNLVSLLGFSAVVVTDTDSKLFSDETPVRVQSMSCISASAIRDFAWVACDQYRWGINEVHVHVQQISKWRTVSAEMTS